VAAPKETARHPADRFQGATDIEKRRDVDNWGMPRENEQSTRGPASISATVVSASPVFLEEIEALAHPLGLKVASSAQNRFRAIDDAIVHDPDLVIVDAGVAETVDLPDLISALTESLALRCVIVESPGGDPLYADLRGEPLTRTVHRPLSAAALSSALSRP
jgi:hypothetical protein